MFFGKLKSHDDPFDLLKIYTFSKHFRRCSGPQRIDVILCKILIVSSFSRYFLIIFLLDLLLKVISHGLLLSPFSYLRSGWNILDLVLDILL